MIDNAGSAGDVNPEQSVGKHPVNSRKQTVIKLVRSLSACFFTSKVGSPPSAQLQPRQLTDTFFFRENNHESAAEVAGQKVRSLIVFAGNGTLVTPRVGSRLVSALQRTLSTSSRGSRCVFSPPTTPPMEGPCPSCNLCKHFHLASHDCCQVNPLWSAAL